MTVSKAEKARALLSVVIRRPGEAIDRVRHVAEVRMGRLMTRPPEYLTTALEQVERDLVRHFGGEADFLRDEAAAVESRVQERMAETRRNNPITAVHDGDFVLARLCYLGVRLIRPNKIVETGVASGVSSTFLLSALEANGGDGVLHSIDLPPLGPRVEDYVGILVPEELRSRWQLHRGSSRRVLPGLLSRLGTIDLFVHDALHTYWSQRAELRDVSRHLSERALVLADDIQENAAFHEWVAEQTPPFSAFLQEESKQGLMGIAAFG